MVAEWRVEIVVELSSGIKLKAGGFLAASWRLLRLPASCQALCPRTDRKLNGSIDNPYPESRVAAVLGRYVFGTMSGKYAFTKTLKEVRFHFCQTSEPSAAVR